MKIKFIWERFQNYKNQIFEGIFWTLVDKWKVEVLQSDKFKIFISSAGIDTWGQVFSDDLLDKEKKANNIWSEEEEEDFSVFIKYAGWGSENINGLLRGNKRIFFPKLVEDQIAVLSKSLSNYKTEDNVIVIRRFPRIFLPKRLRKGDIIQEFGFLSTSLNLSYRLDNQSVYKPIDKEVLMLLKVPSGTEACYIESISKRKEYELLIQKGQRIKIEKNIRILSNRIVVGEILN